MQPSTRFYFIYLLLLPVLLTVVKYQVKHPVDSILASSVARFNNSLNDASGSLSSSTSFQVERAFDYLVQLSHEEKGFGEHYFTSKKCQDVHQWLLNWLRTSVQTRVPSDAQYEIIVDEQNVSRDFKSTVLGRSEMRRYANVTNVLAIVRPRTDHTYTKEAILIGSHFDSRISSTGAFDDGVPVVVMMEHLNAMIHDLNQNKFTLKHPVIFLWNGAEEMGLLGAHAFMDTHPLAKDVRALINLEAAGFGGGTFLFQTTNAWITKEYAKVVAHPFGNALGQDLFGSGLVPSDTDYHFFTKMKKQQVLHGVDTAFIDNGHWYHSYLDSLTTNNYSHADIKTSIIHMADNYGNLLRHLASMDASYPEDTPDSTSSSAYFDILGLVFFAYSVEQAKPVYFGLIIVAATLIVLQVLTGRVTLLSIPISLISALICLLGGVASSVAVAHVFHFVLGRPLSWYALGSDYAYVLYSVPALLGSLVLSKLLGTIISQRYLNKASLYIASMILWSTLLALSAKYGLGCSSAPAIVLCSLIVGFLFGWMDILQMSITLTLPSIQFISLGLIIATAFSGMFGRSGDKPVDYVMGGLVGLATAFCVNGTLSFIYPDYLPEGKQKQRQSKRQTTKQPLNVSMGVSWFIIMLLSIALGGLIFYSYTAHPYARLAPKRLSLRHILKYDNKGKVVDSYLNLKSADPIKVDYVFNKTGISDHGFSYSTKHKSHVISNIESKNLDDPIYYRNVQSEISDSLDQSLFNTQVSIATEKVSDVMNRYTVTLSCDKHLFNQQVLVRTDRSDIITGWSFTGTQPSYNDKEQAYVWDHLAGYSRYSTEEQNDQEPKVQSFSMDVKSGEEKHISIHVRSHFLDRAIWTESIHTTLKKLPEWTFTVPSVTSEVTVSL